MRLPFLAAMLPLFAGAGEINLSGKVYDESGKPVFGASILLTRAGVYTASRPDGTWQITATIPDSGRPGLPDTLVYSMKGAEADRVLIPTWFQSAIGEVIPTGGEAAFQADGDVACAERDTAPDEQGHYARQSVTHLGSLLLRGTARGLSQERSSAILKQMERNLRLPRFDDNPLPASLVREFIQAANEMGDPSDQDLSDLMDRMLVPRILEIVRLDALARAAGRQSDEQRSSFISSKAKLLDITGSQLLSVMRSAWIYIPVVNDVKLESTQDFATAGVSMSLLWFHIACDSATGRLHAKLEGAPSTMGFMMAKRNPKSLDPKAPERFSFNSAAKTCVRQLLTRTKEMKAFNLSGQVVEVGRFSAAADIGLRDGVAKNDQYYLIENVKGKDGVDRPTEVGWIRVYSRDDSVKSWGRVVSGNPYAGLALKEVSLSGVSIELGYLSESVKATQEFGTEFDRIGDPTKMSGAGMSGSLSGVQFNAFYSLSWWYGLAVGLGGNYLTSSLSTTIPRIPQPTTVLTNVKEKIELSTWDVKFAIRQTIPVYKRLGAYIEPQVSVRLMKGDATASTNGRQSSVDLNGNSLQYGVSGGLELALFPSLNLRAQLGSSSFRNDLGNDIRLNNDGLVFGFQLQWTPPALGFDPFDALIGQMGPGM